MSDTLQALVAKVGADGQVDAAEVVALRSNIFANGQVDRAEADAMFALNDHVTGANNDQSYQDLMVEVVTNHVLSDSQSPGVVDEAEAAWLIERIEGDGQVDGVELAICRAIKTQAVSVPSSLAAKFNEWGV